MTNGREPFDAGGKHAVQGRCLEPLLERWLQNHYFQRTAAEVRCAAWSSASDFLNRAIEQARRSDGHLHDILCTMTHFVARAIVHAMQTCLPNMPDRRLPERSRRANGFLWHLLEQRLHPMSDCENRHARGVPRRHGRHGERGLAALAIDGVPANVPSVTGATGQRQLGQFTPGNRDQLGPLR